MAVPEVTMGFSGNAPDDATPVGLCTVEDLVAVLAKRCLAVCLVVPGQAIDPKLAGQSVVHLRGVDTLRLCCFSRASSEQIRGQWRAFVGAGGLGGLSVCEACYREYLKH